MTDPLIDRDKIAAVIYGDGYLEPYIPSRDRADAVMTYLREVLTTEALDEQTGWVETPGYQGHYYFPNGATLHRRIFGEDK
jgi:hypothetical protein